MKTWNAPEMEELDVRMTLDGTVYSYEESMDGFKAYMQDNNIPEYTPEDYQNFRKIYAGSPS